MGGSTGVNLYSPAAASVAAGPALARAGGRGFSLEDLRRDTAGCDGGSTDTRAAEPLPLRMRTDACTRGSTRVSPAICRRQSSQESVIDSKSQSAQGAWCGLSENKRWRKIYRGGGSCSPCTRWSSTSSSRPAGAPRDPWSWRPSCETKEKCIESKKVKRQELVIFTPLHFALFWRSQWGG
jgi:hypothetical protein